MDTAILLRCERRDGAQRAGLVAFDLLSLEGEDLHKLPLETRRARLEALIEPDGAILFSEAIEGDGALAFAKACEAPRERILERALPKLAQGQKPGVCASVRAR